MSETTGVAEITATQLTGTSMKLDIAGVVALFLVHGLVVSTWVSRVAAVKETLRLSDGDLGLALFGGAAGAVTAIPAAGWAVGRFGSRRVSLWSAAGFALSLALLSFAPGLSLLFAALFVYGAMTGANDVSMNAQAVGVEKRAGRPIISRLHAMFSLGGIAGAALGGAAGARGIPPWVHLPAMSLVLLALITLSAKLVPDLREAKFSQGGPKLPLRNLPLPLIALSAIGFCMFLSEGAVSDWTAVYFRQVLGTGEGTAAAGFAVFCASMTVFRLLGDAVTMRLGRTNTIRLGGLIGMAGLSMVVTAASPALALAGFAVTGAGFASIVPLVFAAGGRVKGVSEAAGVATVSGVGYVGFLVGPPLIGFISEMSSLRVGLGLLVALSLVTVLLARDPEAD